MATTAITVIATAAHPEEATRTDADHRLLLAYPLPRVMSLHFKRLIARQKITKVVGFSEILDLKPFVLLPRDISEPPALLYRLYGVVVHSGGAGGGHYTAYVKQEGQGSNGALWRHASDTSVSAVSLDHVLGCQAYMLFYEALDGPEASAAMEVMEAMKVLEAQGNGSNGALSASARDHGSGTGGGEGQDKEGDTDARAAPRGTTTTSSSKKKDAAFDLLEEGISGTSKKKDKKKKKK